MRSKERTDRQQ